MEYKLQTAEFFTTRERIILWEKTDNDEQNEQTATSVYGRGNEGKWMGLATTRAQQDRTSLAIQIFSVKKG
jgi:hypothetical protein